MTARDSREGSLFCKEHRSSQNIPKSYEVDVVGPKKKPGRAGLKETVKGVFQQSLESTFRESKPSEPAELANR
jgi:hypothetical protein